jgi:hypothetical protein
MKTSLLVSVLIIISLSAIDSPRGEGVTIRRPNALQVELTIDTVAGKSYGLQSSMNLLQWIDEERIAGTGTPQFRLKSIQNSGGRFYRLPPITYTEYWPLVLGSQWTYEPGFGGGPRIDAITGVETTQGVHCYKWERQEASPDDYHETRWLSSDQGTVRMYQIASNEGLPTAGAPCNPPWLIVKSTFAQSETWSEQLTISGGLLRLTATVNSTNGTAIVPAGTFFNCLVLRYHFEITSGGNTEHDYAEEWFAPGVGLVMSNDYSDAWVTLTHSQKLTGYQIGSN